MSFLGMTRNSLGTRHCVTKKKKISQGSCIIIHSTSAYLFSVLFLCFVVFLFQFSSSSFFIVSHDLRLCFFWSWCIFFSFRKPLFFSPSTLLRCKRDKQLGKNQNGGGRDVFRRQSCINNRYILSF